MFNNSLLQRNAARCIIPARGVFGKGLRGAHPLPRSCTSCYWRYWGELLWEHLVGSSVLALRVPALRGGFSSIRLFQLYLRLYSEAFHVVSVLFVS